MRGLALLAVLATLSVIVGCAPDTEPGEPLANRPFEPLTRIDLDLLGEDGQRKIRRRERYLEAQLHRVPTQPANLARAWGELAMSYHAFGFREAAITGYEKAETFTDVDFRWPYYRAHALHRQGRDAATVEAIQTALTLRPNHIPGLLLLADAHWDGGGIDSARAAWEKVLALEPQTAKAWRGLGQIALAHKDYRLAIECFEKVLELDPQANQVHYSLALAWQGQGDGDRAAEHLTLRGKRGPWVRDPLLDRLESENAYRHQFRGREALKAGDFKLAEQELAKALAADPDNFGLRIELAGARSRLGDLDAAMLLYREAEELAPDDARLQYNLGTALIEQGEVAEALIHLEYTVVLDPQHRPARFNLAWVLSSGGRPADALRHLEELIRLDPGHLRARLRRAEIKAEIYGLEAACVDVKESLRYYPGNPQLLALSARFGGECRE